MVESGVSCQTDDSLEIRPSGNASEIFTVSGNTSKLNVCVIEDVHEASAVLSVEGVNNTRLTHFEMMSSAGQAAFSQIHTRHFNVLWITMPHAYFNRNVPEGKKHHSLQSKHAAHWKRMTEWIATAHSIDSPVILYGQPGTTGEWTKRDHCFYPNYYNHRKYFELQR